MHSDLFTEHAYPCMEYLHIACGGSWAALIYKSNLQAGRDGGMEIMVEDVLGF